MSKENGTILEKVSWFFRGRYSIHSDAMQPKLKDFPKLQKAMTEHKP